MKNMPGPINGGEEGGHEKLDVTKIDWNAWRWACSCY